MSDSIAHVATFAVAGAKECSTDVSRHAGGYVRVQNEV